MRETCHMETLLYSTWFLNTKTYGNWYSEVEYMILWRDAKTLNSGTPSGYWKKFKFRTLLSVEMVSQNANMYLFLVEHCSCGGWTGWSECTRSCGGGFQTRKRQCTPPKSGLESCTNEEQETQLCNLNVCPGMSSYCFICLKISRPINFIT